MKNIVIAASATLVLLSAVGVAGATQMKVSTLPSRSATVSCTVPNNVSCKISSIKGIKSVLIKAGAAQGAVELVDKTYNGCPTQVTVAWDSAYEMGSKTIVECKGKAIRAN
jgi:hypothetical protein